MNRVHSYDVRGPEMVLEWLQQALGSHPDLSLSEVSSPEDDSLKDFRLLSSVLCDGIEDIDLATQLGAELVWLLNGALTILRPMFRFRPNQKVTPENLFDNPAAQPCFQDVAILKRPPIKISAINTDMGSLPYQETEPDYLLYKRLMKERDQNQSDDSDSRVMCLINLAISDEGTSLESERDYVLIKLCGMEMNWNTIYMLRETLKAAPGDAVKPTDRDQKIGNTCNNFSIAKFAARHGLREKDSGSAAKTVSLTQAAVWTLESVRTYFLQRIP